MNYTTPDNFISTRKNSLRSLGLGLLAATALAAFTGAPAAHAAAGDDAYVVTVTKDAAASTTLDAAVKCPNGERAIGGGANGIGSKGSDQVVSGPLDSSGTTAGTTDGDIPVYWYTAVTNYTGQSQTYKFYAICSASSDATVQAAELEILPDGHPAARAAYCPTGERAISGGVGTTEQRPSDIYTHESGPLEQSGTTQNTDDGDIARSWYATISGFVGSRAKVFAICSPTSQATIEATTLTFDGGVVGGNYVGCRPGTRMLGGGMGTLGDPAGVFLTYGGPGQGNLQTGDVPYGWRTAFWSTTLGGASYKIFAICEGPGGAAPGAAPDPAPAPAADQVQTTTPDQAQTLTGTRPLCAQTEATIVGTEAGETITGTPGDDVIVTLGGDDTIIASGGNDVVCAGAGNDNLKGGGGTDLLFGEDGKDTLKGGAGRDSCYGGLGRDGLSCERGR